MGNSANGFRDLLAVVDLDTYCRLTWEYNIPLFLVKFMIPETGEILPVDPRGIMSQVTERAGKLGGWKCIAGAELEVSQARVSWLLKIDWGLISSTFNSQRRQGRLRKRVSEV